MHNEKSMDTPPRVGRNGPKYQRHMPVQAPDSAMNMALNYRAGQKEIAGLGMQASSAPSSVSIKYEIGDTVLDMYKWRCWQIL